jgi:hypothetical protein
MYPQAFADRFWARVEKTDTCWLWIGARGGEGDRYGVVDSETVPLNSRYVHRVAWELVCGPIPPGLCVCHACDQPLCVRPDHLFIGTQLDNMRDMFRKGRNRVVSTLTPDDVRLIKYLLVAGDVPRKTIAASFGVPIWTVHNIAQRKAWRNVHV